MPAEPGQHPLPKLQRVQLAAVVGYASLSPQASAKIEGCSSVLEALDALEKAGCHLDAARLFAHTLPEREAVWWTCMCARHTAPADLAAADRAALAAAELWVRRQTDEARREAMSKAHRTGFRTPEAWAGFAAFLSGDSISLPDLPKVPPAPHLAGTVVTGAIQLASVRGDPTRQPTRLRRFLESARDIAAGGAGRLESETA